MKFLFALITLQILFLQVKCQRKSIFTVPLLPQAKGQKSSQNPFAGMLLPQEPIITDNSTNSAILNKGWLKYFYYMPTDKNEEPKTFEYNSAFVAQMSGNFIPTMEKDSFGFFDIPTETSFFFVLTHKSLYVLSARKNGIAKTVKSLQLSWIKPVFAKGNNAMTSKGGLENIGDFEEGYCFRLRLKTGMTWDICADKLSDKTKWMQMIFEEIPKTDGKPPTEGDTSSVGTGGLGGMVSSVSTKFVYNASSWFNAAEADAKLAKRRDGKWVVIHDWSQCTRACGAGESFQQRMCIPPVNGGRPCFGESILKKKCNENPCSNTIIADASSLGSGNNTAFVSTTNAPIIKIKQLSDRYQKFVPCVVKESHLPLLSGS